MPRTFRWGLRPLSLGKLALLGFLGFSLAVSTSYALPPVPGQLDNTGIPSAIMDVPQPQLTPVTSARVIEDELRIITPPGTQLLVKNRFLLRNPNRLVIDIDHAELPDQVIELPAGRLGPIPYAHIRLGQFDATTVRVVVESAEAENLNVSLGKGTNNLLRVYSPDVGNVATRFFHRILGRQPNRGPQVAYTTPTRPTTSDGRPMIGAPLTYPATPINRLKIVDIARSQLGVSKAVDREYVNNTYSLGKDQAWCADFVSTVLNWAGGSPWGHTALVRDIYDWGVTHRRIKPFPEPGDVAIFRFSVSGFDHTAIVENINPDHSFTTIGGNEGSSSGLAPGGMVQRTRYMMQDPRIIGYVAPI